MQIDWWYICIAFLIAVLLIFQNYVRFTCNSLYYPAAGSGVSVLLCDGDMEEEEYGR